MRKLYNLSQLVLLSYNTSMTPTTTPSTNGTTGTGIDDVMSGIFNLQTLFFAIISAVGVFILATNGIAAYKSYSDHEGGGDFSKKLTQAILGLLMMSISGVIAFLTA